MTKGKPWSASQVKRLRELVDAKTSLNVIAEIFGVSSDAVQKKCNRLGLEVVGGTVLATTTSIIIPKELPSVEEAAGMLAGALKAACKPGLDRVEVQRLQVVATLARTYKDLIADYLDYRRLEVELMELRKRYDETSKA